MADPFPSVAVPARGVCACFASSIEWPVVLFYIHLLLYRLFSRNTHKNNALLFTHTQDEMQKVQSKGSKLANGMMDGSTRNHN